ncbi:MAG: RluA family pseudouridine synthase [Clostridia bacterium]|nr:RluA family pseudouridine synthase [Clostridia bacterium]
MTEQTVRLTVSPEQEGLRVDVLVSDAVEELTRSGVQKLLSEEHVSIDGKPVGKSRKVKAGEVVEVDIPAPQAIVAEAQDIPLTIVYEDADLLVVDKPKGMVVHPAPGNPDGTLVNALLWHCGDSLSGINGELRPGIVHRIDKDTSGLLVVAKNDMAHAALQKQIQDHSFTREYRAVVHGNFREDSGTIDAPIGRNPKDRKKMAVTTQHSRNAVTHWEVLERFRDYTYIKCRLETGRTHQIRVHMAYQGHPVAGDPVYGPANTPKSLQGQCLHAGLIGFTHLRTGEYLEFSSELPESFTKFLRGLESTRRE